MREAERGDKRSEVGVSLLRNLMRGRALKKAKDRVIPSLGKGRKGFLQHTVKG